MEMIDEYQLRTVETLIKALEAVDELIADANTLSELIDIEKLIGVTAAMKLEGWKAVANLLSKLKSPYALTYQKLVERWEEIVAMMPDEDERW